MNTTHISFQYNAACVHDEKLLKEGSNRGNKESVSGLKYGSFDTVIQHGTRERKREGGGGGFFVPRVGKEAKVTSDGYSKWCSSETITSAYGSSG